MLAHASAWRSIHSVPLLLAFCALAAGSKAQQPVKDINAKPLILAISSEPSPGAIDQWDSNQFLRLSSWTYFVCSTVATGRELFRTNGLKVELVRDINPGPEDSKPYGLVSIRGKIYFSAEESKHGRELWVSDGTPQGTRLFADIVPGPIGSTPVGPSGISKGRILCSGGAYGQTGLVVTDGTAAGTKRIAANLVPYGSRGTSAVQDESIAYFSDLKGELWMTDGTTKGTRPLVKSGKPVVGFYLRPFGKTGMIFETLGPKKAHVIWATHGTASNTVPLLTLQDSNLGGLQGLLPSISFKGRIWFPGLFGGTHYLFSTDGTPKGTVPLVSILGRKRMGALTTDGQSLWFGLDNYQGTAREVWTSDGTKKGTRLWASIPVRAGAYLAATGGKVYMNGYTSATGSEPWVSDGTKLGTHLIKDIVQGSPGADPVLITEVAPGQVMFSAKVGPSRIREAWISWGTSKSTRLLDLKPWTKVLDTVDDKVHGIVGLNGRVLFSADDGKTGAELWQSDGTATGTTLLKDIQPGPKGSMPYSAHGRLGGSVLFAADDGKSGTELWISDGTRAGTRLLKDIEPGSGSSQPTLFHPVLDKVFFLAHTSSTGRELWVSDGTSRGTVLVKEVYPAQPGIWDVEIATLGEGRIVFSHFSGRTPLGVDFWVSDGTAVGTKKFFSVPFKSPFFIGPTHVFSYGGRVFFAAADSQRGLELWVTDGSKKGTSLFVNLASDSQKMTSGSPSHFYRRGGLFYFEAYSQTTGRGLWVSDGTRKGTRYHGTLGALDGAGSFTSLGDRHLYFSGWDPLGQRQLGVLDSTNQVKFYSQLNPRGNAWPGNTRRQARLPGWSWPYELPFAAENGALWFSAKKHGYDRQLYSISEHAVAQTLGVSLATTTLSSTDPVQGQSARIEAKTGIRNPLLFIMLGLPASRPVSIPGVNWLYYDLSSFALPVGTGLGSQLRIGLPIPGDSTLRGVKAVLQAWGMDPQSFPSSLELSNAVHWRIGR